MEPSPVAGCIAPTLCAAQLGHSPAENSRVDVHVCVHHQKGSEKPTYKTGASHGQFIFEMTVRYDGV